MSRDALVEDIREDIRVAQRSLEREKYQAWKEDAWLVRRDGRGGEEEGLEGRNIRHGDVGQKDIVAISQAQ